jgi:uncharacterized protein with PQ loop repeat
VDLGNPWDWLILAASVGFTVSLMPQLFRTLKRRRANDLSVPFLVLVLVSSACGAPYFLHTGEFVFAAAQGVNLLVWGVVLYYRLWPAPGTVPAPPTPPSAQP